LLCFVQLSLLPYHHSSLYLSTATSLPSNGELDALDVDTVEDLPTERDDWLILAGRGTGVEPPFPEECFTAVVTLCDFVVTFFVDVASFCFPMSIQFKRRLQYI